MLTPEQPKSIEAAGIAMAVKSIRWALVIGQQCLCELERIDRACTEKTPDAQRPIHPTGSDDTHAQFADALRRVESLAAGELTAERAPGDGAGVPAERIELALEACHETDALAGVLAKRGHSSNEPDFVARGLALRMQTLAAVVLAALADPADTPAAIRARLLGHGLAAELSAGREGGAP